MCLVYSDSKERERERQEYDSLTRLGLLALLKKIVKCEQQQQQQKQRLQGKTQPKDIERHKHKLI